MEATDKNHECPVFLTSHTLGKKFSIPILQDIGHGEFGGFNEWARRTGATPRMLSMRMKELTESGLIHRNESGYLLTKKGRDLFQIIEHMKLFNARWGGRKDCAGRNCARCDLFLNSVSRRK